MLSTVVEWESDLVVLRFSPMPEFRQCCVVSLARESIIYAVDSLQMPLIIQMEYMFLTFCSVIFLNLYGSCVMDYVAWEGKMPIGDRSMDKKGETEPLSPCVFRISFSSCLRFRYTPNASSWMLFLLYVIMTAWKVLFNFNYLLHFKPLLFICKLFLFKCYYPSNFLYDSTLNYWTGIAMETKEGGWFVDHAMIPGMSQNGHCHPSVRVRRVGYFFMNTKTRICLLLIIDESWLSWTDRVWCCLMVLLCYC